MIPRFTDGILLGFGDRDLLAQGQCTDLLIFSTRIGTDIHKLRYIIDLAGQTYRGALISGGTAILRNAAVGRTAILGHAAIALNTGALLERTANNTGDLLTAIGCTNRSHTISHRRHNAINKGWLEGWKAKGYAKVKNPDLWMRFEPLLHRHRVAFHWIKGHAGHPENERCDALAVAAGAGAVAAGIQLPPDPGYKNEETLI